ncbi:MAG: sensor histidine kinase [Oliverpabstia sp.]
MKHLHSKSIFGQLVIFSLLISLVPIIIISIFLFRKLENMVIEELADSHGQIVSQYTKNIDEKLEQYRNSLEVISNNTLIVNTLQNEAENVYDKGQIVSEEVSKSLLLDKKNEIRNCVVYSIVTENEIYGPSVTMMEEGSREGWYLKERAMKEGWFSYFALQNRQPVLSFVKNIEKVDIDDFSRQQLGIVKLDIDMIKLFEPAVQTGESDAVYDVIVYDDNWNVLYSSNTDNNKILPKYLSHSEANSEKAELIQEIDAYILSQESLSEYGIKMLFLFDNKELEQKKSEIAYMVYPMILIIVLLVIGCVYLYSRDFSSRIEILVKKFRTAETGDLTIRNPIEGKDEIAVLDQQFSHMLKKLDLLIKKNYIQQLENKETQLKNLQLQINPHFLYNTLETISSIAAVKQAFVVCDMCQKLGDIFRYSLGKNYGEFVTLEQELDHTKNYIFIQKIRHGDRLDVFYDIEVNAGQYHILRFILQPIVENAILHGLENLTGKGTLEISAYEQQDALILKVADDGIGMEKQKVEELNIYINSEGPDDDTKKSIGIRNVNQRIKLACGEEYGITIESFPYRGSCFTIRLPIIEGGNHNET